MEGGRAVSGLREAAGAGRRTARERDKGQATREKGGGGRTEDRGRERGRRKREAGRRERGRESGSYDDERQKGG